MKPWWDQLDCGRGRQLSRRSFNVAQDVFAFTLLKECLTTSACGLSDQISNESRVRSHMDLELFTCDQIT